MRKDRVYIVGVAPDGAESLSVQACHLLNEAELVLGGERLLKACAPIPGEQVVIRNNLAEVAELIRANLGRKRMVVLASGDPGFFGIAKYLVGKLDRQKVDIIPNVSSMQVAFARIKESWEDAALVSVHARPIEEIVETVRSARKVGIFTDDKNTPAEIARVLLEHGIADCRAYVCQDLGTSNERVVSARLSKLKSMKVSSLSVMVLVRDDAEKDSGDSLLGIPEARFARKAGLITKLEVRAISLAMMGLNQRSTVWDIGAGSGAVSIEAAGLAARGQVFAVEKDADAVARINTNVKRFGRHNVTVVQACAPEGLDKLPDPNAVFIGGSGGNMEAILACVCRRLKPGGRVVINVATFENLNKAVAALEANGFSAETTLVNVSRSKDISGLTRLEPLNPVFVVIGKRRREAGK